MTPSNEKTPTSPSPSPSPSRRATVHAIGTNPDERAHLDAGGYGQDRRNGSFNRQRSRTARDYAQRVQEHASIRASESLHPGDSLRNLAEFLWQPYVLRPPQLGGDLHPPTSFRSDQACCFVSLYQVSDNNMSRELFRTVQQFESLGDSVVPGPGSFAFLLLQGYPSPEWLNALGARFEIDPEYFHRHLIFASRSTKSPAKRTVTQILPSCLGDMVSLQVTTIASRHAGDSAITQASLDDLRRRTSSEMGSYMEKLASLNHPSVAAGDSVVREFSLHGPDYFSLEHTVSIAIHSSGQGWIGIVWDDDGGQLDKGLVGPWQTPEIRSNSLEISFLPTLSHNPGVVLRSRKKKTHSQFQHSGRPPTRMELVFNDYARTMDLSRAAYDVYYALSPFFNLAVSSEMEFLDLISARTKGELDHARLIRRDNPTLSNLLYHQQVLKRHIQSLQLPIGFMEQLQDRPWVIDMENKQREQCMKTIQSALADYRAALAYAESLAAECVQGMSIVAHNASIHEAEKAIIEARGVTKLTRLATLFVPLAFVSSVFSINVQQINSTGPDIWWWIVTSIVVGALAGIYTSNNIILRAWRAWKRGT
ncbi:hypothetical protein F4859DRAFT_473212, partial [Xylaria cf. heliscus]